MVTHHYTSRFVCAHGPDAAFLFFLKSIISLNDIFCNLYQDIISTLVFCGASASLS